MRSFGASPALWRADGSRCLRIGEAKQPLSAISLLVRAYGAEYSFFS
jgi:hypothetical protein